MKNLIKQVSQKIKRLRDDRGWSLDTTSQQTGVSKAMLGQIEREESVPTISTLWKISEGFGVSISFFIKEDTELKKPAIFRSNVQKSDYRQDGTFKVTTVFPFDKELLLEIFIIELSPKYEHLSTPHRAGTIEHVIVVQGCVEVLINGNWQRLEKNQGVVFAADKAHGYRNVSSKKAVFHNIMHYKDCFIG